MSEAAPRRVVLRTLMFQGGTTALQLVVGITVARRLGSDGKGLHALATLLMALAVLVLSGSLPAAVVHFASTGRLRLRALQSQISLTVLSLAAICLPSGVLLLFVGAPPIAGVPPDLAAIALLAVPTETAVTLVAALLQGSERLAYANALTLTKAGMLATWTFFLVVVADFGVAGAVAALPAAGLCATVFGVALAGRPFHHWLPRMDRESGGVLIGYAARGYMANISQFLSYRIDLFVLEITNSLAAVGIYSVAVRIAEILWQLPNAVAYVLLPGVARLQRKDIRTEVTGALRLTVGVSLLAALLLAASAPFLVPLLYGDEFAGAVVAIWLLLPGIVAMAGTKVFGNVMSGRGRPGLASAVSAGSLLVSVALDVALIPRFGIPGAAIATSGAYILTALLAWRMYERLFKEPE